MATRQEILIKIQERDVRWVDIFFNTNFNASMTSKLLKPHLSLQSAGVDGHRMLKKANVQELIAVKREHLKMKEDIQLSYLVQELKDIVLDVKQEQIERDDNGRVTSKPDRANAIRAIDTLAKLAGLYTNKVDVTSNGKEVLQEITINIVKPKEKEEENED